MCKFCELYNYQKQAAKEFKKETGINTTFRASLIEIRTKDRVRRGKLTHDSVKLVFCPECGMRLSGSRTGGKR